MENQRAPLETFRDAQSWKPAKVYEDQESAFRNGNRPAFTRMLADATRHEYDILLFWSLDRFCREGAFKTLWYLNQLSEAGVKFRSYMEPYIDTSNPMGEAIVGLLAALAKQESVRKSERVKAGMARARLQGKRVGGRRRAFSLEEFARMNDKLTVKELMRHFQISRGMVYKVRGELPGADVG